MYFLRGYLEELDWVWRKPNSKTNTEHAKGGNIIWLRTISTKFEQNFTLKKNPEHRWKLSELTNTNISTTLQQFGMIHAQQHCLSNWMDQDTLPSFSC